MKKSLTAFLLLIQLMVLAQKKTAISFTGFYIAKTGAVAAANVDIYTYLRFYQDGSVYLQSVSSYEPQAVSAWFGRYKKFSQKGTYQVDGSTINIQLNNKESKDFQLEGLQETSYTGTIQSDLKMCLKEKTAAKENCFEFSPVLDSTRLKYSSFKPEIKLPGEWWVKQILKSSGQVFFTNSDSTIIGISVFKADRLPVYKATQTSFESAYAYYEWDANYMRDEKKMVVKKITDNKDKAFVIWNAKDQYNDNYNLFACHLDLLYNIMIYDTQMPVEKQLKLIELLYDINKE